MQFFSSLLLMAAAAQAHYHFPRLIVNGKADAADWATVRQTKNYQSNQGVTSVTSPDMRCYQMVTGAPSVASVVAGDTVGFEAVSAITHFGPLQFYMAKVPAGQQVTSWDPAGNVWFKVASISAVVNGRALTSTDATWPAYEKTTVTFQMPKSIPDGQYLLRVESIALHQAQQVGGAQMYLSCAQLSVSGGGSGTPGPLVAFPGAYKPTDPGLLWSYSTPQMNYTAPGPAVWQG